MYVFLSGDVQEPSLHLGQPKDQPVADHAGEGDEAEPSHPVGPGGGGHWPVQQGIHQLKRVHSVGRPISGVYAVACTVLLPITVVIWYIYMFTG